MSRHERYQSRITVDLDGDHSEDFRLRAIRTWHFLDGVADDVKVHVSTGQQGLHFVAWFREALEFHEQISIRRQAADDARRIDMDIQRWLQVGPEFTDVLFNQKGDRENVKERRFSDVYDALDYVDAYGSDDADRVRRLANDGHKGAPDLARKGPKGWA
jgi:hypothetical protein